MNNLNDMDICPLLTGNTIVEVEVLTYCLLSVILY